MGAWLCGCVELGGLSQSYGHLAYSGKMGGFWNKEEKNEVLALLSRLLVLSPESQGNDQKSTPV
jgi:hypothetical protein